MTGPNITATPEAAKLADSKRGWHGSKQDPEKCPCWDCMRARGETPKPGHGKDILGQHFNSVTGKPDHRRNAREKEEQKRARVAKQAKHNRPERKK